MKKVVILALGHGVPSTATDPLDVFHHAGILWNQVRNTGRTPF